MTDLPRPQTRRTAVVRSVARAARGVVLRLDVPDRVPHLPGQHYVVRLVAEDGYVAQRSYSIASAPSDPLVELYVERLADGEVSTFLADVLEVGDQLQVQGPIGGWFVWEAERPALGVVGGSGVVPIVAMLRHATDVGRRDLLDLAVSARSRADLPYADELAAAGALIALTRVGDGRRPVGRLQAAELGALLVADQTCFVCGSYEFTNAVDRMLAGVGVDARQLRFERFGPSG